MVADGWAACSAPAQGAAFRTVQALALANAGEDNAAVDALAGTLTLACPQGYVRVFADEGALLGRVIAAHRAEQAAAHGVPLGYLARRHCRARARPPKIPPAYAPSGDAPRRRRLLTSSRTVHERGGALPCYRAWTWRLAEEMTVKRIRTHRPRARRERPGREALPPDPRDPDIVRAKALARAGNPVGG